MKKKNKILRDYVLVLLSLEVQDGEGDVQKYVHEFIDIYPEFETVDLVMDYVEKDGSNKILNHNHAYKKITKNTSMEGLVRVLH